MTFHVNTASSKNRFSCVTDDTRKEEGCLWAKTALLGFTKECLCKKKWEMWLVFTSVCLIILMDFTNCGDEDFLADRNLARPLSRWCVANAKQKLILWHQANRTHHNSHLMFVVIPEYISFCKKGKQVLIEVNTGYISFTFETVFLTTHSKWKILKSHSWLTTSCSIIIWKVLIVFKTVKAHNTLWTHLRGKTALIKSIHGTENTKQAGEIASHL